MSQTTNELRALVLNHRRHVELSPGVGEDAQSYALAVLDDLLNDLAAPAPGAGGDVLARGWYHWNEEEQDYELYPNKDPGCDKCIPVLIVRADGRHEQAQGGMAVA